MSFEIDLNLDGMDPDALERGNALPEGWFPAIVDDVHPDAKNEGTAVLEFRIDGGDYDGVKVYDRLHDPSMAKDTEAAKVCDNRRAIFAKRLGLIVKDPNDPAGKRYVVNTARCPNGRIDFEAAIGELVVLKLTKRNVKDETTGKWGKKDKAEIDFAGVFGRDHPGIPAEVAQQLGRPTLLPPDAPPPAMNMVPVGPGPRTQPPATAAVKPPTAQARDPLAGL